ncbi:MAG: glycoside hydrolase family 16 protein [Clostridiales bacterium]|jgi:hypothetical protein|nr:glycoside hydrolase family 16 protein [Clostridiales bacterium]
MRKKKLAAWLLSILCAIAFFACGIPGGGEPVIPPEDGGKEAVAPPKENKPVEETPVWNKEPTVTGSFFEDFASGISTSVWEICNQKWGLANNGTSPANVLFSTSRALAAAEGCESGGIAVLRSTGDYHETPSKRRQGAAIITRQAFGPGKYEVRMKVLPRLGQCTAAWTFYDGGGSTAETNKYSEIDIEMPMHADFRKWSGTSYKYFYDWQVLAERGTAEAETDGVNDGQWHTYAFEWRTDEANGDSAVVWYMDGEKMFEIRDYTPRYTATFWIGSWFPNDAGWVGSPAFEEAYMYVDWVKITKYGDPVLAGASGNGSGGSPVNLGSDPIPQNQYVANPAFKQFADGNFAAWEKSGSADSGGASSVLLGGGSKLTQFIAAQYPGYSFDLNVRARVTGGTGKLKIYAEYMFGSVRMGKSEELLFENSGAAADKTLNFTIPKPGASTDVRIVAETESGVAATIERIELYLK